MSVLPFISTLFKSSLPEVVYKNNYSLEFYKNSKENTPSTIFFLLKLRAETYNFISFPLKIERFLRTVFL